MKLLVLWPRDRTIWTISRVIFFLSLSGRVVYHFCSRNFPCRLKSKMKCIMVAGPPLLLPSEWRVANAVHTRARAECRSRRGWQVRRPPLSFLSLGSFIIITYYKENIMIVFTKTHIRCPASSSDLPQSVISLCPFSMCDTDMKPEKPCL